MWDDFTNLYSLSKTLRFELKPIGDTAKLLEDNQVWQKDKNIYLKYQQTKPFIDRLHREFIIEALSDNIHISGLSDYSEVYKKYTSDKQNSQFKEALIKKDADLRQEIITFLDSFASNNWAVRYKYLKIDGINILFQDIVFENILKARYGKEETSYLRDESGNILLDDNGEKISIFGSWKNFTGYFIKFFETRRNFYKTDGTSTAITTRMIDQNLHRFCDNLEVLKKIQTKIDLSEIESWTESNLNETFSIGSYQKYLLQDGIDFYNKIIGGETLENGHKRKGINELVNLYRQNHKDDKLPRLRKLDKQILGNKEKVTWANEIENDNELIVTLREFFLNAENKVEKAKNIINRFVDNNEDYDLNKIYVTKEALNSIINRWIMAKDAFNQTLFDVVAAKENKSYYNSMRLDKTDPTIKKDKDNFSFPMFVKLAHIKTALQNMDRTSLWKDKYTQNKTIAKNDDAWTQFLCIYVYEFKSLFSRQTAINSEVDENTEPQAGYNFYKPSFGKLLSNYSGTSDDKIIIKGFADDVLHIYQMMKYFALEKKRAWLDIYELNDIFYEDETGFLDYYSEAYEQLVQPYNKIRNYLTRKPFSQEKWKLNFENPTLADGWDKNKESDNTAIILRKDNRYYLAIMDKKHVQLFSDKTLMSISNPSNEPCFEKMVYKFLPDPSKMMPKVCFSKKNIDIMKPSKEILEIRKNNEYKKGATFSIANMQKLIDFYKRALTIYDGWSNYNFVHVKQTSAYTSNIGEFFRDVSEDGYSLSFVDISEQYIMDENRNGELYLFEIYNRDKAVGKKQASTKNLHTIYFESVFSTVNTGLNFPIKLNGQAEIFFRPETSPEKLGKRTDNQGKEVIKSKRYAENKLFFHVPITLNRTAKNASRFNTAINERLATADDVCFIGIDRGEKHLAYYSVINTRGEVIDTESLNVINGVDYHALLTKRANKRNDARINWQDIEQIKDLKKGYISQVVRKIADLAIKHNAIIVLEDLNMRFKQVRGGIEKSVYQQLEKALIDKLSFLVEKKETDPTHPGSIYKAYQLTAPFESFKAMGKQTGIIFYTQASYTSQIDPVSGWRPNLYLKYTSANQAKKDILMFKNITYNGAYFEFSYNLSDFVNLTTPPKHTLWTICSCVERHRWNKKLNNNQGDYDHFDDVSNELKRTFEGMVDITGDIQAQIKQLETSGNEKFFKDLIFYIGLICQIRNTDTDGNDYIQSPVAPFFDSRKADNFGNLPKNGDENGAYNIARKGALILDRISEFKNINGSCEKLTWKDLYISHTDWDNYAQK